MDSDEFRAILLRSGFGIWDMIDAAIKVAGSDYGDQLRRRRDGIVESLYAPAARVCRNCGGDGDQEHFFCNRSNNNIYNNNNYNSSDDMDNNDKHIREDDKKIDADELKSNRNFNEGYSSSPLTPESNHRNFSGGEGEEPDPSGGLFDDEQTKILSIKKQLEDQNQSEDAVAELLQNLADMDITFQALKETDIGRHVNRLRKHPSNEVRRLVKQLVRKWKDTVDEWVKVNEPRKTSNLIADVDSPQQSIPKNQQNGHHQVLDNGYSPNPQNGNSGAERNYVETEAKPRQLQSSAPRRDPPPSRPPQSVPKSAPPPNNLQRAQKEGALDDERLNSARRRLQENYQEAQNAKKQRTIQVMDIHEIPKPKKGFIPKNNKGLQGRHHW